MAESERNMNGARVCFYGRLLWGKQVEGAVSDMCYSRSALITTNARV